jgi:hypothetical protein
VAAKLVTDFVVLPMPIEKWRPIPGLRFYLASNLGLIRSLPQRIRKDYISKRKILKPHLGKNGYLTVGIYGTTTTIHTLIAKTFKSNPYNLRLVEHIDDVKTNNISSNLRWSTQKINVRSALKNGRLHLGENASWAKLKNKQVLMIRADKRSHGKIAADFNICRQTVSEIKNRLIWKHI